MKIVKKILLFILCITMLMAGLIFTNTGLKIDLKIAEILSSSSLYIQGVEGSLYRGFSLKKLNFQDKSLNIRLDEIYIQLKLSSLVNKKLDVEKIEINNGEIGYSANNDKISNTDYDLTWTRYICLNNLHIKNIDYLKANHRIKINSLLYNANGSLHIITSDGNINGSIHISLTPYIIWAIHLEVNEFQPDIFLADYPGRIHFNIKSEGSWQSKKPRIALKVSQLKGTIRQYPVNGNIDIDYYNDNLILKIFNLKIFNSQFFAKGNLDKKWNLAWKAIIPTLNYYSEKLHGHLSISGNLSGKRKIPEMSGVISLINFNTSNVNIKDLHAKFYSRNMYENINITMSGNHLKYKDISLPNMQSLLTFYRGGTFHGEVNSRNQRAKISGNIHQRNNDPFLIMNITGDHLKFKKMQVYHIVFSPDLNLYISNQLMNVTGRISVHHARITPPDFSQVTTLPDEVTIQQDKKPVAEGIPGLTYKIDLDLKNIKLTYHNLDVSLKGLLKIIQTENSLPIGVGTLYITDGQYKIYHQALQINQGKLVYAGNLLTNPSIDIKAIKYFDNAGYSEISNQFQKTVNPFYAGRKELIVGVKLDNFASNPHASFFSDPGGMSQNDILSILVFGVPKSQIKNAASVVLLNDISNSLSSTSSSSKLEKVKNKIEKKLYLTELRIGSTQVYDPAKNASSDVTTVNVGSKIGKNLSMQYKTGVFTPFSILSLQYKLNDNLTIQTETSSLETAADLLYEFEID